MSNAIRKVSRAWCFTVNNPQGPLNFDTSPASLVRYAIYQEERGESGTPHYQGYIELNKPQRGSALKKLPGLETAHLEARQGRREQARDYCRKEDSRIAGPWEFGTWGDGQGDRTDLKAVKRRIDEGATELEIFDEFFGEAVRFHKAFQYYRLLKTPDRKEKTTVYLLVGAPGTGKSRSCLEAYPNAYWKPKGQWWDGYQAQEAIILDDFYGWLPWQELLHIMDRYPLQTQTKGGTVRFLAKNLAITSNTPPDNWYKPNPNIQMEAFYRRVDRYAIFGPLQNGQSTQFWSQSEEEEEDWHKRMTNFQREYYRLYPLMNRSGSVDVNNNNEFEGYAPDLNEME